MINITPGATATHEWYVPIPSYLLSHGKIDYTQDGVVVLEKDVEFEWNDYKSSKFSLNLTQEETLLFAQNTLSKVQINVITNNGQRVVSRIVKVPVGRQIYTEVME